MLSIFYAYLHFSPEGQNAPEALGAMIDRYHVIEPAACLCCYCWSDLTVAGGSDATIQERLALWAGPLWTTASSADTSGQSGHDQ